MSCNFRGGRSSDSWESPHDRARARLSERMTEPLDPDESAWLVLHLVDCPACQAVDAAYREDRDLLRAMRVIPPPRDLWARTSAALDVEQARASGRRSGRSRRRTTAPRGRATGARVFSFPRGGWAPVGAIGSIAAVMVVGFLLGNMIVGGGSTPVGTPGIAVLPTATPKALPTHITVAQADVSWVSTGADGSIVVRQAPVGEVCPSDAPAGCAPIDSAANDVVRLPVKPKSVHQSPTSGQMIVFGQSPGLTGFSMFVVNYGKAPTPSPTPSAHPTATTTPRPTAVATPTPSATPSANPATSSPDVTPPASPTPAVTASGAPTASAAPTPPATSPTPNPSPTASIIPNVTPPPSAATMIAVASDLAVLDTQTAAYSADGAWFAFTARLHGESSGSDIYLWHAGDATATAATGDHRSVFAGWAGDRMVGSRADDPSPAPVGPAEFGTTSFLVDPATLAATVIPGAAWRPAIDPTGRFVVYWSGTVALDPTTGGWRTATGRLVLAAWPLAAPPVATPEPSVSPSASEPASAAPSASASASASAKASHEAPSAAPSTTPSPSPIASSLPASAAPSPSLVATQQPPAGLPDDIGTAAGVEWAVGWDEAGTHLAVWIGDHGDPSFGHLDLLVVAATGGSPSIAAEPLRAQPALPGFSLADGHFVWATPPGVNGSGSQLQVYAYSGANAGVTSGQGQTGSDTVIVVQR